MLEWALIFFIVAIISGALGFSNIAGAATTIAKWLFGLFLLMFIIFLAMAFVLGEAMF